MPMIEPYSWFSRTIHQTWRLPTGGAERCEVGDAGRDDRLVGWADGAASTDRAGPSEPPSTPVPSLGDASLDRGGPPDGVRLSAENAMSPTSSPATAITARPALQPPADR